MNLGAIEKTRCQTNLPHPGGSSSANTNALRGHLSSILAPVSPQFLEQFAPKGSHSINLCLIIMSHNGDTVAENIWGLHQVKER